MSQLFDKIRETASLWRSRSLEHRGGVVLVWKGSVYGWKDSLRDASHERPGACAVDEVGRIFIAKGGDDHNGAQCWVEADRSDE